MNKQNAYANSVKQLLEGLKSKDLNVYDIAAIAHATVANVYKWLGGTSVPSGNSFYRLVEYSYLHCPEVLNF